MADIGASPLPTPYDILPMRLFPFVPSFGDWCLLFGGAVFAFSCLYLIRKFRTRRGVSLKIFRTTMEDLRSIQSLSPHGPLATSAIQRLSSAVRRYLTVAGVPDALSRSIRELQMLSENSGSEAIRRISPILSLIERSRFEPNVQVDSSALNELIPLIMALEEERTKKELEQKLAKKGTTL